ncbi:MAG TPA: UbiA family prenyltransferase [Candidatus Sulfotelmatobacter sp.]|nr:UbiA family prenyltransferase [Candidatus Sulfotelmatobacter sp.]HWI56414.1 UbiA family prenyltransferase [Bacillota bacterium]
MPSLRTILALGRLSRLPTIWSNCLAGWWLGGGGHAHHLPYLFAGATLLYWGAGFLNDAFDAEYDREHRRGRPIPAGAIAQDSVWRWGLAWLVGGTLLLLCAGKVTGGLALALVFLIILYNTIHKLITFSPVLLGICRFFLYVLGASVAEDGVTGWSIWCGLALGAYIIGFGYFARWERTPALARYWPALLFFVPVGLALTMNAGRFREPALLLSAVLVLWTLRCLRPTFWSAERNLTRTVSGLVAGIVFVDWLAIVGAPRELSAAFILLFLLTLGLQRVLPET